MRLLDAPTDLDTGRARYVVTAWLLALLPSLAFLGLRVVAGNASFATPIGPGVLAFAAYSILGAPLLETAVMLPLAAALRRLPARSDLPRIAVLALLAAAVHAAQGGLWAGAGALWPFLVYSACLFAWWRQSWRSAFAITVSVHALYNAGLLGVGLAAGELASGAAIRP